MKISEKIAELEAVLAEHGDIECIYSKDDEGNGFHPANVGGLLMAELEDGELPYNIDVCNLDELDEDDLDFYVKVYCIN